MSKYLTSDLLLVNTNNGRNFVNTNKIIFLKAKDKYVQIYIDGSESITAMHLLKWIESQLSKPQFFRCHKSYINQEITTIFLKRIMRHILRTAFNSIHYIVTHSIFLLLTLD